MLINSQTKIAALIKHHPDALEAIVTISPDFKKLRNPVLRKLMANRTSIWMASKIAGCKPQDFFNTLKPYGFEVDPVATADQIPEEPKHLSEFIKEVQSAHIITLDVRAMLAGGNDPLKLIQQKVKALNPGQVLKIINTFEPSPLMDLLEKQGFKTYVDVIKNDHFETYFYRTNANGEVQLEATTEVTNDWDMILKHYVNKLQMIDVRHLQMPKPMMVIFEAMEKLPEDYALYVQHKRIPVFLLTELKDQDYDYRIKEVGEGEVFLLIFRN